MKSIKKRKIFISINFKIITAVTFILIFMLFIVVNIVINLETKLQKIQFYENISIYLETFKKEIDLTLQNNLTYSALNSFLSSYKNIKNFIGAMLLDNKGNIILSTFNPKYNVNLTKIENNDLIEKYNKYFLNQPVFDKFEIYTKNIPKYISNDLFGNFLSKISNKNKIDFLLKIYLPDKYTNVYQLKDNITKAEKSKLLKIIEETDLNVVIAYDSWVPVYNYLLIQSYSNIFQEIENYIKYYENGNLFSKKIDNLEIINNFKFIKEFENLIKYTNTYELNKKQMNFINQIIKKFNKYKICEEILLNNQEYSNLVVIFKDLGLSDSKLDEYNLLRYKYKKLFNNTNIMTGEIKNNINYINFINNVLDKFAYTNEVESECFSNFVKFSENFYLLLENNTNMVKSGIIKKNIILVLRNLENIRDKLLEYIYENKIIDKKYIEDSLVLLKNLFRIGTIRILIDHQETVLERINVINRIINIFLLICVRFIILLFFIIYYLISPLKLLAIKTDSIANGNLDEKIYIKSNDEIGNLAEKFNNMTSKLKIAFQQIKEKARMEEELKTAKEIQEAILPKKFPNLSSYKFAVYYKPQTESGGDYYDFIEIDNNHIGIVIADVTGHGVGAGIVMAMLRSALRTHAKKSLDPSIVLKEINPILFRDTLPTMFATVFYGVLNISDKELYYTIAGHNPGIIYNPNKNIIRVMKAGGMPVGMVDSGIFNPSIELYKVKFDINDLLILFTDGIIEAKSAKNEEFTEERFYKVIKQSYNENLDIMIENIIKSIKQFTDNAPQSDDITLLLMSIK